MRLVDSLMLAVLFLELVSVWRCCKRRLMSALWVGSLRCRETTAPQWRELKLFFL